MLFVAIILIIPIRVSITNFIPLNRFKLIFIFISLIFMPYLFIPFYGSYLFLKSIPLFKTFYRNFSSGGGSNNKNNPNNNKPKYPNKPVKVYEDASLCKPDFKSYRNKSIIYMWFNKVNGRVYIGSAYNGYNRLLSYYQPSVLGRKDIVSLIYRAILKYGHANFSLIILEVIGDKDNVSKSFIFEREKYFLDWALKNLWFRCVQSTKSTW